MKNFLLGLSTVAIGLSLVIAPVSAEEKVIGTDIVGNTKIPTIVAPLNDEMNVAKMEKAKVELKKAQDELVKVQAKIKLEIEKAKTNRDTGLQNAMDKEKKLDEELQKVQDNDKVETEKLNTEIQKWTEHQQNTEKNLNDRLTQMDTKLVEALAKIDNQIAKAKDDATKTQLNDLKTKITQYNTLRKAAISKYLENSKSIWIDRQKIWNERKALLIKRQTADLEYRQAMRDTRKAELDVYIEGQKSKTDDAVTLKITQKYQKKIDSLNIKIQKLEQFLNIMY